MRRSPCPSTSRLARAAAIAAFAVLSAGANVAVAARGASAPDTLARADRAPASTPDDEPADDAVVTIPSLAPLAAPVPTGRARAAVPPAGAVSPTTADGHGEARDAIVDHRDVFYRFEPLTEGSPPLARAQAHLRRRRYKRALRVLDKLLAANPAAEVEQAALWLQARAWQGLDADGRAEATWRRLAQSGPLAPTARLQLAELAEKRGDIDAAIAAWAGIPAWHGAWEEARLRIAAAELERGQCGRCEATLERLDVEALTGAEQARAELLEARVAALRGEQTRAVRTYKRLWTERTDAVADKALAALTALGSPPTEFDELLRAAEAPVSGRHRWRKLEKRIKRQAGRTPGMADMGLAVVYARRRASRAKAPPHFETAARLLERPEDRAEASYRLGDVLGRLGRDEEAAAVLEALLASAPLPTMQARTLRRLQRLYDALGKPDKAEACLRRVLDEHDDVPDRHHVLWGVAWRRFVAGDHVTALAMFAELEARWGKATTGARQPWAARAHYWQARSLGKLGRHAEALDAFARVAEQWPQSYYGVIALDRVRDADPDRALQLAGLPPSPPRPDLPPPTLDRVRVRRHAQLDEAAMLVRLGEQRRARLVLRRQLGKGLPRDGVELLAALYHEIERPRMAFAVLQRYTRDAARPDEATAPTWRQAYPTPFADAVESAVAAPAVASARLPRSLLYAVARHESAFVPTARSGRGAMGLTQLLPSVARSVATHFELEVKSKRALRQPDYNLALGAHYLAELTRFYQGNHVMAVAAYNAGPYAVKRWWKRTGKVPTDVFVEQIPYGQARAYAKRVIATEQAYAWLNPQWGEAERVGRGRHPYTPEQLGPFFERDADRPDAAARPDAGPARGAGLPAAPRL
jgi:soluble lytic murein transglycosylase